MAEQWQIRRGTTAENDDFVGAVGELTMDTEKKQIRIHDGNTQGGVEIPSANTADYVVESQFPTADNNYTWYRKYRSGWAEQGGIQSIGNQSQATVNLPITMSDTNYTIVVGFQDSGTTKRNDPLTIFGNNTTSSFILAHQAGGTMKCHWQVSGMAA